jgi:hypothetical protein
MKISAAKVNSARAEQGAWVRDIPELPGVGFQVRGFGTKDDKKILELETEKVPRHRRQRGKLTQEDQDRIMNARIAGLPNLKPKPIPGALIAWEGLEDDDGQPLPLTPDVLKTVLTDPDLVKLRTAIIWAVGIVAEDAAEAEGDDAKN